MELKYILNKGVTAAFIVIFLANILLFCKGLTDSELACADENGYAYSDFVFYYNDCVEFLKSADNSELTEKINLYYRENVTDENKQSLLAVVKQLQAQADYVNSYASDIEWSVSQAETMISFNIYNDKSSYSYNNILKRRYDLKNLKEYINHNPKLRNKVTVIKYKKEEYIISLEFNYYKDVYTLKESFNLAKYTLEELISIGKYKINLFQEHLFSFLNFLEIHLDPHNIDLIINDLIFYCGFDINNDSILLQICDNIEELYKEVKEVIPNFPIWIYNGNTLNTLKDSIILPNKNEPCLCGSGKKYKNCCEKLFK